ncbi:16S rRNA (guanine(527)-N(7))-methyltransferase RsmG [Loktanella sp. DJP18]|uniref:16S rRNA (guanine(527)-N(7))-methyltransferase RsmG n=1 Tax=Loktanella sp. DJP18 TaxID=3409788 RepID=UPI003BB7AD30
MTSHSLEQLDVSRETIERLRTYHDLLLKWTSAINLISRSTVSDAWDRHIVDSAQLFKLLPPNATMLVDIGSGGGLPGLVLAIMALEQRPRLQTILIESDQRKATFLRAVVRDLSLNAEVRAVRIESVTDIACDVVTARALAPLPELLPFAKALMKPEGVALFQKGKGAGEELTSARQKWKFEVEIHPSLTDPDGRILEIKDIARADQ